MGGGIEFTSSGGIQIGAFTGDVTKATGGTALTIAANAVGTAKIADGAVTTAKINDNAVVTAKIVDNAVTNAKISSATLKAIADLGVADGNFIVGDGSTWVVENGSAARASLGLAIGTDVQAFQAVQATNIWETGTGPTESVVSPAKVKAAIDSLAPTSPSGSIINSAYGEYTANADLTATIPADDTIPQNTEGTEIVTATITPTSASLDNVWGQSTPFISGWDGAWRETGESVSVNVGSAGEKIITALDQPTTPTCIESVTIDVGGSAPGDVGVTVLSREASSLTPLASEWTLTYGGSSLNNCGNPTSSPLPCNPSTQYDYTLTGISGGRVVSITSTDTPPGYTFGGITNSQGGGSSATLFPTSSDMSFFIDFVSTGSSGFSLVSSNDIAIGDTPGTSSSTTITVDPFGGHTDTVALSASSEDLKSYNVSYDFSDDSLTNLEYSTGSTFSVTANETIPDGIYDVTITGTSATFTESVSIRLGISAGGTQCNDGIDNDGDGFVDLLDPDCDDSDDDDEGPSSDPEPTVNLNAIPEEVVVGGTSVLGWSVTNATSCIASGGWSGSKNPSGGMEDITNITSDTTFTLTCSGPGGTDWTFDVVRVRQPQCNDGSDNDSDTFVDFDGGGVGLPDPGCTDATDDDESDITLPECSDLKDNDGDGKIDSADPRCHTDGDASNPGSYDPNDDSEEPIDFRIEEF